MREEGERERGRERGREGKRVGVEGGPFSVTTAEGGKREGGRENHSHSSINLPVYT